ncbi:hypothetical protein K469DRAFT_692198 [Zopfia rhizophila CBS 207.26]|uniref:Uncharacterized protein n=1 Tax=Zopfia rhizophila CBS 207.26 TaxID=1314779 RepID=A0A6A6DUK1_9PEZI|nr:hypothetical protein K469DRAFT_692198 [Zopfia rhizophila CBS 207.26]
MDRGLRYERSHRERWRFTGYLKRRCGGFRGFVPLVGFDENSVRKYFICVDNEILEEEGVLLVRMDWDVDVSMSDEELLDLQAMDKVETMRIPVKEAFGMIEKAPKRDSSGLSEEAVRFSS